MKFFLYLCTANQNNKTMIFYELNQKVNAELSVLTELADEMYDTLKAIIAKNGGEIDMSNKKVDCAFAVECFYHENKMVETPITALRVSEQGVVQYKCEYYGDGIWNDLRYGENYYLPTLFSIMENVFGHLPIEER